MKWKSLVVDLLPPILLRALKPARPKRVVSQVAVHTVAGGPLKGRRITVDAHRPAFREMVEGSYDPYIWEVVPKELPAGVILDVGAHIGYHSMAFAALYPGCEVIAFEPNPANLERLQAMLELEPELAERIKVLPIALSDSAGEMEFEASTNVDDQTSSGGYLGSVKPPLETAVYERAGFTTSKVLCERLDDLVEREGWRAVHLMKIDVEGAEALVLQGARGLLQRDHPHLLIEIHSAARMMEVMKLLQPMGYAIDLLHEDRPGRCFIQAVHANGRTTAAV
ncbi:MAG: FkbM family methyltransferase [Flavobacteriales bacterium]|nr:FkbM family methyltransferase [Flavobacteriales bacterium]